MRKSIFILSPSLEIGGAERVLLNLLKKIDYKSYDVTLCLFSRHGEYLNEIPKQVNLCSIFNSKFFARSLTFLQRKYKITYLIRLYTRKAINTHFDVGICFSDGLLTDVLLFAENKFKKKITWVHSCYKSQQSLKNVYTEDYRKKLIKNRYSFINDIVYVSQNARKEFEELFGFHSNGHVIYNILDSHEVIEKSKSRYHSDIKSDVINIIAISRLMKVKEYHKLIEAAKILADKKIKFKIRIIGDGKLKKELKIYANELGLNNYINFLGSNPNPYPLLKQSDILVLTSSSEALPTVLFEAMVLEIPILSTKTSGSIEISDNGKYALLSGHSVQEISENLEQMILKPELREFYSKKSNERMNKFRSEVSLNKIYNLFNV